MFNKLIMEETFINRKNTCYGYTYVLYPNEKLKTKLDNINQKIVENIQIDNIYEPYKDSLHLTISALKSDTNNNSIKQIIDLEEQFPSLINNSSKVSIFENGLVVLNLFFSDEQGFQLEYFRKQLGKFNFLHIHSDKLKQLHSVLGIIDFNLFRKLNEKEQIKIFQNINETLSTIDMIKGIQFQKNHLKIIKFKNKELKNPQFLS